MDITPCVICGAMPIIEKISHSYWNATHHECLGEPGVSVVNSKDSDQAIIAWNKWQKRVARHEVAIIRVDWLTAKLTAPQQIPLFAEGPICPSQ